MLRRNKKSAAAPSADHVAEAAGSASMAAAPQSRKKKSRTRRVASFTLIYIIMIPVFLGGGLFYAQGWPSSWSTANWSSAGIAPVPAANREAIIQVYAARTGRWKGIFSVHTWIAMKRRGERRFTRYDVVGWGRPVRRNAYPVDGRWYSNTPRVVYEIRGKKAERLIPKLNKVVKRYPARQRGSYKVWPGPNSNTFIAWIARQVPELGLELPALAVGKDYLGPGLQAGRTPSGTGYQFNVSGYFGMALGWKEGLELHLLGSTIGIDPESLAIKLPSLGKLSLLDLLPAPASARPDAQRSESKMPVGL